MEKIATDTYSFERLRTEGCVYVDKTAVLKKLADGSIGTQFFIARPRRFGKSLAVSTLHCLFEGRRDLFKGLAIENDWNWEKTWPVLHLDMSSCQAATVEKLWEKLDDLLVSESERLEIPLRGKSPSSRFRFLIEDLARRNREEIVSRGCGAAGVRALPCGDGVDGRGRTPGAPSATEWVKGQMVLLVDGGGEGEFSGGARGARSETGT